MTYFKIGNTDYSAFVSGLKIGHETIVSDKSGRNAAGSMSIDIVARKYKLYVTFRPMTVSEVNSLLNSISGFSNLSITFLNPFTATPTTITCYTNTPEVEYYTIQNSLQLTKDFSVNFIEL